MIPSWVCPSCDNGNRGGEAACPYCGLALEQALANVSYKGVGWGWFEFSEFLYGDEDPKSSQSDEELE